MVLPASDPERQFAGAVRPPVVSNLIVGNHLDQPGAEDGRRNPEDDVLGDHLRLEVFLIGRAAGGIRAARYGEQAVDTAVGGSVRILLEARLTHRSIESDEGWDRVP